MLRKLFLEPIVFFPNFAEIGVNPILEKSKKKVVFLKGGSPKLLSTKAFEKMSKNCLNTMIHLKKYIRKVNFTQQQHRVLFDNFVLTNDK